MAFGFVVMFVLWIVDVKEFSIINSGTFLSVLIAVLAVIVALVVGFQISNAIEVKRKMDEMSKKMNDIDELKKELKIKGERIENFGNAAMKGVSTALIAIANTQKNEYDQVRIKIMSIVIESRCNIKKNETNNHLIARYKDIQCKMCKFISNNDFREPLWWTDFKSIEYPKEMSGYDEIISAHRSVIVKIDEALEAKKAKEQAPQS